MMSYMVFFNFSSGLNETIYAPLGTLNSIQQRIAKVTERLGLHVNQREGGQRIWSARPHPTDPKRWLSATTPHPGVSDEEFCEVAEAHNRFVRRLYEQFGEWSDHPVPGGESITPDDAKTFWYGLQFIDVPPERWTREYYVQRMEHLFEVMRGRESEGVHFDADALTTKQAAAVIVLFSEYLDEYDVRLDAPKGRDHLASSDDGGYDWCSTHGAVVWEDGMCCDDPECELHQEWVKVHDEDDESPDDEA